MPHVVEVALSAYPEHGPFPGGSGFVALTPLAWAFVVAVPHPVRTHAVRSA